MLKFLNNKGERWRKRKEKGKEEGKVNTRCCINRNQGLDLYG